MDRTPNKGGRPKVFLTKDVVERQKMLRKRRNDSRGKLHGGSTQAAGTPAPEQQRGNGMGYYKFCIASLERILKATKHNDQINIGPCSSRFPSGNSAESPTI